MPAPQLLPDNEVLVKMRQRGWTYDEIAQEYGVSRGAVYLRLRQVGHTKTRPNHKELIPWKVKREHQSAVPAKMLRLLSRRQQGEPIPEMKARMLDKWLKDIAEQDVVVCYRPDMPGNDASPTVGGWYYSKRRKSDGESLIRIDPDAELSDHTVDK